MFDKFGEFDTYNEINMAAEGLKEEGDTDNIFILAEENGIDKDFAQMYIDGDIPCLCDIATAAAGKLEVEMKQKEVEAYKTKIPAQPIVEYLKSELLKEDMAGAVREKGKSLLSCLKHVETEAKKIVTRQQPYLADAVVFKMAKDYYLGGTGK